MGEYDDRAVLVTGGAAGIGEAIVRGAVAAGARVCIVDRDASSGSKLAAELGPTAHFHRADVCDAEQVAGMVAHAVETLGRLDVLFNNAGGPTLGRVDQVSPEAWTKAFDLNVHSVFHACRAAVPVMREQGGGVIVNIASVSGLRADPGMLAYNAAKAAVLNLTRTLAVDHGADGIRVNAICPGPTATRLTAPIFSMPKIKDAFAEAIPLGRVGQPAEVAQAALFLGSDAASFISGTSLVVDGGVSASTGQPSAQRLMGG